MCGWGRVVEHKGPAAAGCEAENAVVTVGAAVDGPGQLVTQIRVGRQQCASGCGGSAQRLPQGSHPCLDQLTAGRRRSVCENRYVVGAYYHDREGLFAVRAPLVLDTEGELIRSTVAFGQRLCGCSLVVQGISPGSGAAVDRQRAISTGAAGTAVHAPAENGSVVSIHRTRIARGGINARHQQTRARGAIFANFGDQQRT